MVESQEGEAKGNIEIFEFFLADAMKKEYMRARGIAEKEARLLLMFAFVNEVIDTIRLDALKDRLHLLVEKRFRGELNRCQGCAICK